MISEPTVPYFSLLLSQHRILLHHRRNKQKISDHPENMQVHKKG